MKHRRLSKVIRALGVFLVVLALPAAAAAATRDGIVLDSDGPLVPSASTAPWSARIYMDDADELASCTGTIVDATHILTAAHCTLDAGTGQQFATGAYEVAAGITDTQTGSPQLRDVSAVRVMPGYASSTDIDDDDIAELTLSTPLVFNAAVGAIGLGQAGAAAVGQSATFYGWGEVSNGVVDGLERYLTDVIASPWTCGGGEPSIVCASSQVGDSCAGDSGAGLITQGATPELIGILDYSLSTEDGQCASGHPTGFTDVTSPEIAQWIAGVPNPTPAPRTDGDPVITVPQTQVGGTATCVAPSWTDATSTSYLFLTADGTTLQTEGSTLTIPASALGKSIECVSKATSAGGTTYSDASTPTTAIRPQSNPDLKLSVKSTGLASVSGADASRLKLTLTATATGPGAPRTSRTFRLSSHHTASLSSLAVGAYAVCVSSASQGVYARADLCTRWAHNGNALSFVSTRTGKDELTLRAQPPLAHRTVDVEWYEPGHHAGERRSVRLGTSSVVHPPQKLDGRWRAVVTVPRLSWHGATLAGGHKSVYVSA